MARLAHVFRKEWQNMKHHNFSLHTIIETLPQGILEARLIELDIVAAGKTVGDLLSEFSRLIDAHYEIAIDLGQKPFHLLKRDEVKGFVEMTVFDEMGEIHLRPEVAQALAAILHAPKTNGLHIKSLSKAA